MSVAYKSLTGRWMGRYEYDRNGTPTAFEADLFENGEVLSGDVFEPNTFRPDMGAELSATISGARSGPQVSFIKRYVGFDQRENPIYDGVADAGLTRIEGRWRFNEISGWGGRFVMIRKARAGARAQTKAEESADA